MLNYINRGRAHNANLKNINMLRDKSKYPLFKGWDIIIREKAEFIANNHRVKALKEYIHRSKSSENK